MAFALFGVGHRIQIYVYDVYSKYLFWTEFYLLWLVLYIKCCFNDCNEYPQII